MKKLFSLVLAAMLVLSLAACGNSQTSEKSDSYTNSENQNSEKSESEDSNSESGASALVVYFSHTGTTEGVAKEIVTQTNADIFEIIPAVPYTDDYNTLLDVAKEKQQNAARPKISDTISNFDNYDIIYVGFPNWWGDMPMILYTFFDNYDMSEKTIIPFVTSGGSGFSDTISTMKSLEPNDDFLDGLSLGSSEASSPTGAVSDWLKEIGQK